MPSKKGGPRTPEGAAIVSLNAATHGLLAATPVLPGTEDPAEWERHHSGILQSLAPIGHVETSLAERIALLIWRLRRTGRYETIALANYQQRAARDYAAGARAGTTRTSKSSADPETVQHNLRNVHRTIRVLETFPALGDDVYVSGQDADAILSAV